MLAKRIIPCLDIRDGQTVKGINFVGLRQVGDPVELGAKYAAEGADELVYLDISASEEGRRTFTELVARIAARIDIPFTVGGGISSVDDASRLLDAGADKITLNSAAVATPALIAAIGSQGSTGHWICCPGFSCAYGDAIIHGVANSHAAYGCGCCTWPGWGGGSSSFRSLGTDQALLREAYESISAGKPTVVHVAGTAGEHWICLMGYRDVQDPDNLTLGNFIALDPVDGAQIVASDRYSLYGDACEHVSDAL